MALVGHISGSSQSNSVIGVSGSVIVANRPNGLFPVMPGSDVTFFVSGAFDDTATSVFGGKLVVSGGLNTTTVSGSGNFDVGGDLRVAGDIRIDGNDIKSSTGATVITLSDANVIIPGDLTVNGTTTTVSSSNLVIFDQLLGIGFESGSISRANGDRGLIGGLASGNNASVFWDNSESEFAVVRTDSTPESSSVNVVSYAQLHVATLTGSLVKSNALTGSLTKLIDGSDYLRAGSNISILTGSSGEITISSIAGTPTLQDTYDNSSDPATITTAAGKELLISLSSTGPLQIEGPGAVQFGTSALTDIGGFNVQDSGGIELSTSATSTNALHLKTAVSGGIKLSSNSSFVDAGDGEIVLESQNRFFVGANDNITIQSNNVNPGEANILIQAIGPELDANQIKVYTEGTSDTTLLLESKGGITSNAANGHILAPYGTSAGETTPLRFKELAANGGNYVAFKAADSIGSNVTWTLPNADGTTGQFLSTDGSGALSWASTVVAETYFFSTTPGSAYTTGSVAFVGAESIDSPSDKGSDVFFYVSGSTDMSAASNALFGGSVIVSGSLGVEGDVALGLSISNTIAFNGGAISDLLPANDMQYNLGSPSNRWANVYTGDLHLRNDRGNWTVIEEDEYLSIRNNKTGKMFKFVLEPV